MCLYVPRDLADRLSETVLLYSVASLGPREVYSYFRRGNRNPTHYLKFNPPLPQESSEASRGVAAGAKI